MFGQITPGIIMVAIRVDDDQKAIGVLEKIGDTFLIRVPEGKSWKTWSGVSCQREKACVIPDNTCSAPLLRFVRRMRKDISIASVVSPARRELVRIPNGIMTMAHLIVYLKHVGWVINSKWLLFVNGKRVTSRTRVGGGDYVELREK